MPIAALTQLHENVTSAVGALHKIDDTMRESAGSEATPHFELLSTQLARMSQVLRAQLASHPERTGDSAADVETGAAGAGDGPALSGVVKSRQDAIRALDAVAAYFRQTEPSSPIPLFLERAKRLVSKDFLEVLADIAPDALAQARAAGGLKEGE
jgi:type VI secretion system protein ImpA